MASVNASRLLKRLYNSCKIIHRDTKCILPPIDPNVTCEREIEREITKCFNYIERPYYSYLTYANDTKPKNNLSYNRHMVIPCETCDSESSP